MQLQKPLGGLIGLLHEIVQVGDLEHDGRRSAEDRVQLVEAVETVLEEAELLVDEAEVVQRLHVGRLVRKRLAEKLLRLLKIT